MLISVVAGIVSYFGYAALHVYVFLKPVCCVALCWACCSSEDFCPVVKTCAVVDHSSPYLSSRR